MLKLIEPKLATHVPIISTAAAFRYENDVPILIPGINDDHVELLKKQKKNSWMGWIYCSIAKLHYYRISNNSQTNND